MTTTTIARTWAVRRSDGLTLGFTDHDGVLSFEGIAFRPEAGLTAQALVQGLGLAVDNTEAQGVLSDDAITAEDLAAGRWDGAEVRLWEVDWTDVALRRLVFRGSLGEITFAAGAFRAELRGLAEALNRAQGRVYHPRCSALLGDEQCRFDLTREGFWAEGVIASLDEGGARLELRGVPAHRAGWFDHGRIAFLDGPAQGLAGVVKIDAVPAPDVRAVELWAAPGAAPAVGDRVRLTAGCDKRAETCRGKFLNFLNFRGFPHLPPEDWLISPQANGGRR
ncbi:DUF2163 domain-containing protein [Paracoccus sp. (in: a-proteobacteria)]|uniref:DUF2163 domain-containing protein n=1 Tax=Paracoccus sp. TaxID=267 RepID=UPI0026E0FE24|nr:DUF2163 domain-containing protein [Paracoccus sp. (in: a-proteobacteria)]MDO5369852.1 DUF2163 domain-containing protein [Paracoccus sp. (in: a-proteobacteria)]